jgi:predicted Zn-dependent peptidase
MEKVRSVVETDFWSDLDSVDGRAEALGHHQTTLGDFRRLFDMAERLARVSAADVQRVAREYLVAEARCAIVIDPEGDDGDDGDDGDGDGDGGESGRGNGAAQ